MNEKEVTLPRSKGTVWLRTRLSDGRMDQLDESRVRRFPAAAMSLLAKARREGQLLRSADDEETGEFLLANGYGIAELRASAKEADRAAVRVVVKRWAGVYGPEDDGELSFPDGLAEMHPDDFTVLLTECWKAVAEGRADPNATGESSASTSSPALAETNSPSTSETPSDSTASRAA